MIRTTIKSLIQADIALVWYSITSLYDFAWRSDIKAIEISNETHFKEISREGYITYFTVIIAEPFIKYSLFMDNDHFSGEWTGHFKQVENGTEIRFTESINLRKWWLYPFAWLYFRLQQKRYVTDLKRKCEQKNRPIGCVR